MRAPRAILAAVLLLPVAAASQSDPWADLQAASTFLAENKAAEAVPLLDGLVDRYPAHPGIRQLLAAALAEAGRAGDGLAQLEAAARGGARLDPERFARLFGPLAGDEAYRRTAALLELNRAPLGEAALAHELPERDLFAESVAVDPADGTVYVGSMHRRKVVRVAESALPRDLATAEDGLWMVIGIKVDAPRRQLLAASCNYADARPPMLDPDPSTAGRTAAFRFELPSGLLLARHDPLDAPSPLCFNDLAVAADGTAYLTTGPEGIWRLAPGDDAPRKWLAVPGRFLNGIALADDGSTLYAAAHLEGVLRVDLASREFGWVETTPDAPLLGLDGLYLWSGGLVGVQNGSPALGDRVIWAPLDPTGKRVVGYRVLLRGDPRFSVPTTGVVAGDHFLVVANSQLDRLEEDGSLPPLERLAPTAILRLALP